jgi:cation diffusion facilitator CzcD-associated flavoprotein CzcO
MVSNDWYPTLMRPDVELVAGEVQRITENSVIGPDGVEREADVIIYGTGFRSHDFVAPMDVTGLGGRDLNTVWAERPEAYLGRREMEERSRDTAWLAGGCTNWYLNGEGVNTNNWPGPWIEFRRRTHRINPGDYRVAI